MESTTKLLQECGLYVEKTNISRGEKSQLLQDRFSCLSSHGSDDCGHASK